MHAPMHACMQRAEQRAQGMAKFVDKSVRTDLSDQFQRIDEDGDGVINLREWKQVSGREGEGDGGVHGE